MGSGRNGSGSQGARGAIYCSAISLVKGYRLVSTSLGIYEGGLLSMLVSSVHCSALYVVVLYLLGTEDGLLSPKLYEDQGIRAFFCLTISLGGLCYVPSLILLDSIYEGGSLSLVCDFFCYFQGFRLLQ